MSEGLTRQERIERGNANRKAREELRNAVRFCMTQDGVSPSQIREAAKEMAKEAAAHAVKAVTRDGTFESLLRKVVREETELLMGVHRGVATNSMQTMIKEMIRGEAQAYAKSFIDKNLEIKLTEKDTW